MEPKAGPSSPQSFTQVLNIDNSMLMELDIENIQKCDEDHLQFHNVCLHLVFFF